MALALVAGIFCIGIALHPDSAGAQTFSWTVSAQPTLQIGRESGSPDDLLARVVGVRRLPDGRVVVAEGSDASIRFYTPQGAFLLRAGASGQGPGEFQQLTGLLTTPSEIWGLSQSYGPSHVFDLSGKYLRTYRATMPVGVFPGGSYLLADSILMHPPSQPRTLFTDTTVLLRVSRAGDTLRVASLPRTTWLTLPDRAGSRNQEFGPAGSLFVRGNFIYYGFSDKYQVTVLDTSGRTVRTIARSLQPPRVTAEERAEFTTRILMPSTAAMSAARAESELKTRRAIAESMVFPVFHRAFVSFHVDLVNNIWVQQLPADRRGGARELNAKLPSKWDVFSPDGNFRGTIDIPAGLEVHEIGSDYVAGVWRNELGVPFVRIHALRK